MYFECLRSTVHPFLLRAITVAVGAESVLDAQAGELGATVVEEYLGVVGSAKVRVAVDAVVVVQERNRLAKEVALLVNVTGALELQKVSVYSARQKTCDDGIIVHLPQ